MKIFNFSSDYAYQQRTKTAALAPARQLTEPETNAENKTDAGGTGEAGAAPESPETTKARRKKKKEAWPETEEKEEGAS